MAQHNMNIEGSHMIPLVDDGTVPRLIFVNIAVRRGLFARLRAGLLTSLLLDDV